MAEVTGSRRRTELLPAVLLAPALALIGLLLLYPIARTVWMSVHHVGLAELINGGASWVGIDNYRSLFSDAFFWSVFRNTVVLAVTCVVATMVVGTLVALLLARLPRWPRALLSVVVLLPWATPKVAATIVWKWIFDDQNGVLDWLLVRVGLGQFEEYNWFLDTWTAFGVIAILIVWQSFPFVALSMLAGLQTVPKEVVEAARVDGAGAWRTFWLVKVPVMRPIIAVLVILSTIWDFKVFAQVYVMTGGTGGIARSNYVLGLYSYRESFPGHDYSTGSAIAVVMLVVLLVVTGAYVRTMARQGELG